MAAWIVATSWPAVAAAGGFFLPAHGARGLGRAGAFVAGADDPGGIWYNPAAVAGSRGPELLADAALVLNSGSYYRVDAAGVAYRGVENEGKILPIPTLAYSMPLKIRSRQLWIGALLSAPTAALPAYPRPSYDACGDPPFNCLDTAAGDAPQRYALISFGNTLMARFDLAVALKLLPSLTIGLSVQNLVVSLYFMKSLSSFNGVLSSGPEDPEFDALTQVQIVDLFNPSAQLGVQYKPLRWITLGLSLQAPFLIDAEGDIDVQMPASPVYAASRVEGSRADVRMMLPLAVGIGVEVRPLLGLRIEADLHWEHWSGTSTDCPANWVESHGGDEPPGGGCEITIENKNIYMIDIPAIPRYKIPPLGERLGFRDSLSLRVGVEYAFSMLPLILRAGYGYERGAVTPGAESVMAFDRDKHLLTAGASLRLGSFRLDGGYAVVLMPNTFVDYRLSAARQTNPINPELATTIGGGAYHSRSHVLAVGLQKDF